jgi:hypothetical protein
VNKKVYMAVALALIVVTVGWYEGIYRSEKARLASVRAEERVAEGTVLGLETRYSSLAAEKKALPAERAALAKLEQAVPNGPALDVLLKSLFGTAATAGIQVTSVSTPEPAGFGVPVTTVPATTATTVAQGNSKASNTPGTTAAPVAIGPQQLSLSVAVSGSAQGILRYVRLLDADSRLFVVDQFALNFPAVSGSALVRSGASGAEGGTTIQLRAFYASASADSAAS